ncbi:hypothetical protein [Alloactinosynnema sp. L-07]|nr:hypothetical protein [Alloactinosynnema sp. L-07]
MAELVDAARWAVAAPRSVTSAFDSLANDHDVRDPRRHRQLLRP